MDCKTAQQKITSYIHRQLNDRELEEFIEHINSCPTCSEELEVYFTIYYALERLEQDEQGSFNMQELLKKDLEQAKRYLQKRHVLVFYRKFFIGICAMMSLVLAGTGIQAAIYGTIEKTFLYGMFHDETNPSEQTPFTAGVEERTTSEGTAEPETNRKYQVIITIPETEYMTDNVIDLTGVTKSVTMPALQSGDSRTSGE